MTKRPQQTSWLTTSIQVMTNTQNAVDADAPAGTVFGIRLSGSSGIRQVRDMVAESLVVLFIIHEEQVWILFQPAVEDSKD